MGRQRRRSGRAPGPHDRGGGRRREGGGAGSRGDGGGDGPKSGARPATTEGAAVWRRRRRDLRSRARPTAAEGADGVEEEAQGVVEMGVATGRRAEPTAWRRRRSPGVGVEPRKGCGLT
ncbi:hypothetical protein GUJ93_ZPchr0013g35304 [Zizania palustris]|uniref:Uncharacterized protein n=1 Tax=Zizania palustris TaxID=103762 RepID=A0A8J5WYY9_ZIZPA|nr:hypothetical protein GUJ93_ZPchr0013g35304 [Zizania palustris]